MFRAFSFESFIDQGSESENILFQIIWIGTVLLEHTKHFVELWYYCRNKSQNLYSKNCSQIYTDEQGWKKDLIALKILGWASEIKRHLSLRM